MEVWRKTRPLLVAAIAVVLAVFFANYLFRFFNRAKLEKALAGKNSFSLLFAATNAEQKKLQVLSIVQIHPETKRIGVISFFPALRFAEKEPTLDEIYRNGGIKPLAAALANFLGEKTEAYILLPDTALAHAVDLVGGIDYFIPSSDLLKDENLPRGQFILDGSLVVRLLNPPEKNEYTAAIRLFRYYSLLLNAWHQRARLWPLVQDEKVFAQLLRHVQSDASARDLYVLAQQLATQKGWLPILAEIPARRIHDSFLIDSDAATLNFRTLNRQLKQKEHPFVNEPPKMEVKNGTTVANLARTMRAELSRKGVQILEFTNADHNEYEHTILLATSGNAFYLETIARIIGVKHAYAAVNRAQLTDLVLVLGKDYNKLKGEEVR
ncbi:MAG: LytR C-terminal domain-containing protein [Turneriella sp.]|nr:LytR C-terminal domain-containing protein [Turneriella sp.]